MFSRAQRREVFALLCLKAVLLICIYQLFFAPHAKPEPDNRAVRAHLLTEQ